jgi:hypothetical protein
MKKVIFIVLILPLFAQAQILGFFPPYIDYLNQAPSSNISFVYSFRKARTSYTGLCFRARRTDNNAQVDVAFDANGVASGSSTCTVVVVGSSAYTSGQQMTWTTFSTGAPQLRVSIWYDQSGNARNAIQNTAAAQPRITGSRNGLLYLTYAGVENLYCPFASNVLLSANGTTQGVNGSFFLVATPSVGVSPISFGYANNANSSRWAGHLNWVDNNLYFDAGEICCAGVRATPNGTSNGLWKQYSFQRNNTIKLVRVSGIQKINGGGKTDYYDPLHTSFGIGNTGQATSAGHTGFIGEAILFRNVVTNLSDIISIETNQMRSWNAY